MQQDDILNWLLAHYGQELMRPGLSRMKEALKSLMPSFQETTIVTIAGTNGKGETTLRLSEFLKDEPHFVWTSPHIERLSERFRSETGEIDQDHLWSLIQSCHREVLEHKFELSFYEFLFFVFCTWASEHPPKYLLLEVGLGGRLDAVNVFDADLVLIPSISRDHQEILGRRYDDILREKLGVLRKKSRLITFLQSQYLRERTKRFVEELGASHTELTELMDVPDFNFTLRNYLLASAAFSCLKKETFDPETAKVPLKKLPHRGEVISGQNEWHFFGSHNVDGMRKLILFLHSDNYTFSKPSFDSVIVAFSNRNEKDLRVMLRMLKLAGLGKITVTVFPHPKAAPLHVMKALSEEEGLDFAEDIATKVHGLHPAKVLVTGSYYFIGHFKSHHCR